MMPLLLRGVHDVGVAKYTIEHFIDCCPALLQTTTSTPSDTPQAYTANIFNNRPPQQHQQSHDLSTTIQD